MGSATSLTGSKLRFCHLTKLQLKFIGSEKMAPDAPEFDWTGSK